MPTSANESHVSSISFTPARRWERNKKEVTKSVESKEQRDDTTLKCQAPLSHGLHA